MTLETLINILFNALHAGQNQCSWDLTKVICLLMPPIINIFGAPIMRMKAHHTSINLSEEHRQAIAKTGKSSSEIIRTALDAYFNPPKSAADLVREHERLFHLPDIAHKERIKSA